MAPQQHRFSRRFLTLLIFVTCIAIVLLSQMEEAEETAQPSTDQSTQKPNNP